MTRMNLRNIVLAGGIAALTAGLGGCVKNAATPAPTRAQEQYQLLTGEDPARNEYRRLGLNLLYGGLLLGGGIAAAIAKIDYDPAGRPYEKSNGTDNRNTQCTA